MDLARAFASIMETVDLSRVGDHRVTDDETPIALHATDILDRLARLEAELKALATSGGAQGADAQNSARPAEMEFPRDLRRPHPCRGIGLFLAVLELVRQRQIEALQDHINGRIVVRRSRESQAT